jgi:hypothetical protein
MKVIPSEFSAEPCATVFVALMRTLLLISSPSLKLINYEFPWSALYRDLLLEGMLNILDRVLRLIN